MIKPLYSLFQPSWIYSASVGIFYGLWSWFSLAVVEQSWQPTAPVQAKNCQTSNDCVAPAHYSDFSSRTSVKVRQV